MSEQPEDPVTKIVEEHRGFVVFLSSIFVLAMNIFSARVFIPALINSRNDGGLILAFLLFVVLLVANYLFLWKLVFPYLRERNVL